MGVVAINRYDDVTIGIWKLEEDIEHLLERYKLKPHEYATFSKFRSSKRKLEWISVRMLLQQMDSKISIEYINGRKPSIKDDNREISISHSNQYVTVAISETPVGIDIESSSRSISKITSRFLTEQEFQNISSADQFEQATLPFIIWSAKEAFFKLINIPTIKYNIEVNSNIKDLSKDNFIVNYNDTTYRCRYQIFDKQVLVWIKR